MISMCFNLMCLCLFFQKMYMTLYDAYMMSIFVMFSMIKIGLRMRFMCFLSLRDIPVDLMYAFFRMVLYCVYAVAMCAVPMTLHSCLMIVRRFQTEK